ncbi:MAG: methionyl-tRNA formyltransferase [Candidatus Rokuibacteriota bacterium]|nr:MAG: methionyl-tRNA formyltransferase [Candidatus Rokubacteria bacterium]
MTASSGRSRRKVSARTPPATPSRFKVLFYGTPEFALPTLEAVLRHHEVVAVVTQPDRPAHRGRRLTPPPVKTRALAAGLEVIQPARVRDPEWAPRFRALGTDVAVVVAFGQILPKAVLDAPRRGSINVHGSLLPRYRGAAPIQWAIMRGETVTGITTFQMDEGMDTGPILLRASLNIGPAETAGELATRLASLGADVLVETLARLDALTPEPQRHEDATLAPRLKRSDGHLDWHRAARELVNIVRGCNPWPGAITLSRAGALTIWRATASGTGPTDPPGTLARPRPDSEELAIATAEGWLRPIEVQPENRRAMSWAEYLRGARLAPGATFANPDTSRARP